MRHAFVFAVLVTLAALPAAAQSSNIGFTLGVAQPADDGFDVDFGQSLKEIYFSTQVEPDNYFKIKVGRMESDKAPADATDPNGDVDFALALVEYRFSEVYGSSGLFAGGGYYRQKFGNVDEANWGLHAGVNGIFPLTRRYGVIGEFGYHWIDFEDQQSFFTASIGINAKF